MFVEASVYQVRRVPREERQECYGLLVLVMRRWPQGIPRSLIDVWIKDAGPSTQLLHQLHEGLLTTEDFERCYEAEMQERHSCTVKFYTSHGDSSQDHTGSEQTYSCSPIEYLRSLEQSRGGKITLLCWEATAPCHRYVLLRLLTDQQFPVRKTRASDLIS